MRCGRRCWQSMEREAQSNAALLLCFVMRLSWLSWLLLLLLLTACVGAVGWRVHALLWLPARLSPLPDCPPARLLSERPSSASVPASLSPIVSPPSSSSSVSPSASAPPPRSVTSFLISFPRSGSSLVRKMLEASTGLLTGSVYGDPLLLAAGFAGELEQERTLLLKHHFLSWTAHRPNLSSLHDPLQPALSGPHHVRRYLYVVRNPVDALVSYYAYLQSASALGQYSHERELDSLHSAHLVQFVLERIVGWAEHVLLFATTAFSRCHCPRPPGCPAVTLRYEDVIRDGRTALQPALRLLGFASERSCQLPAEAEEAAAAVTYRLKQRRSLLDRRQLLPRHRSYSQELLQMLNCTERERLWRLAGLEMQAFGYWPERQADTDGEDGSDCLW